MVRLSAGRSIFIVALTVAAVLLVFGRRLYSSSIDLALHYSLARNIAEGWAWPHAEDYLAEMGYYPPVTHALAAIVGGLFGSTMLGLTSTALLAVFSIYITLLFMMRFETTVTTFLAFALFCCVAVFFNGNNCLFGGEIVHNFFYAHVVSVSLSFVTFYAISLISGPLQQALLSLGGTVLMGWMYPLAQVYLATSCFSLIALTGLKEFILFRSIKPPTVTALVLLFLGFPLAIIRHPTFANMSKFAEYNPGAFPGSLPVVLIIGSAVALLTVAAILFARDLQCRLDLDNPIRFVAICVAVASSGILQWLVVLLAGKGSVYAIAKHGFAIETLLVASVAVLCANGLNPPSGALVGLPVSLRGRMGHSFAQLLLVTATGFGLMFVVLPRSAGRPIKPLLNAIDFAQHVLRFTLPPIQSEHQS